MIHENGVYYNLRDFPLFSFQKFHLKEEEKGFCIFIAIALQYFG